MTARSCASAEEAPRQWTARPGLSISRRCTMAAPLYIDGTRVADVTTHPSFRNAVRSAAALYDFQARPENIERLTFEPSGGHRRINRSWQKPGDYQELVQRRQALVAWADQSAGFVGRSPDHVASSLLGQVMGIEVFRQHGEARPRRCWTISAMSAATTSSSAM